MSWRLLALDLDGTLLEEDDAILPEAVARLSELVRRGRHVAVASGRPLEDIERILVDAGVRNVCGWPAVIVANERDVYRRNGGRFECDSAWNDRLLAMECAQLPAIRDVLKNWLDAQPDADAFRRYDDEATEDRRGIIALRGPALERVQACQAELARAFEARGLPVQVFRNRAMAVIRHAEICKGRALLRAVEPVSVAPVDVLAIGDTENDLGMLDGRYGFQCACPANAEPAIRAIIERQGGRVAAQPCGRGVLEIIADA